MKYLLVLLFSTHLFGFDVQSIDETKEGKQKALELQKQKDKLAKLYGKSEFTIAKDNKKIYKPVLTVIKAKVYIVKPKANIVKPTVHIVKPTVHIVKAQ